MGTPAEHWSTLLADTWGRYGWTHWPTFKMSSGLQVDMSVDYQSICQSTSVGPVSVTGFNKIDIVLAESITKSTFL